MIEGKLEKAPGKIAVITSRFNRPVTEKMEEGAVATLKEHGYTDDEIIQIRVPGAVEIPLAVKECYEAGCIAAVTVGAVIRGETAHFDYVCNSVERGCTELQLQYSRPLGFGVITTENADQAYARAGGAKGNKGSEASEVVLEMLSLQKMIRAQMS